MGGAAVGPGAAAREDEATADAEGPVVAEDAIEAEEEPRRRRGEAAVGRGGVELGCAVILSLVGAEAGEPLRELGLLGAGVLGAGEPEVLLERDAEAIGARGWRARRGGRRGARVQVGAGREDRRGQEGCERARLIQHEGRSAPSVAPTAALGADGSAGRPFVDGFHVRRPGAGEAVGRHRWMRQPGALVGVTGVQAPSEATRSRAVVPRRARASRGA